MPDKFLAIVTKRDEPKAYVFQAEDAKALIVQLRERSSLKGYRTTLFAFITAKDRSQFQLQGSYLLNIGELWDYSSPQLLTQQIILQTERMSNEAAKLTLQECLDKLQREIETIDYQIDTGEEDFSSQPGAQEDSGRDRSPEHGGDQGAPEQVQAEDDVNHGEAQP